MKPTFNEKFIAYLALLSGLSVSAVAIYYSVAGLVAIFAAAVIPIIVMGVVLEISKLVATVWLKQNWHTAPFLIKLYLGAAVAVLMLITSLGIFGFLSKSHSDQNLVSGDVIAKIAIYDEKIKISRENIDVNRRALRQMDEAVDQVMGRSTTETGADKAAQIRRGQAKDRQRLLSDIEAEQNKISKLSEEKAPIAAEVRKVEAEVGPIKYIAAFVYGDTDQNILEKAVTWVIISLIIVFDPLAIMLLLASQVSFQQFKLRELDLEGDSPTGTKVVVDPQPPTVTESVDDTPITLPEFTEATHAAYAAQHINRVKDIEGSTPWPLDEKIDFDAYPYLFNVSTSSHIVPGIARVNPMVYVEPTELNTGLQESLYIQNEEQTESNLWSTASNVISQQTYLSTSRLRREQQITDIIQQLSQNKIQISELSPEIQEIIKPRM